MRSSPATALVFVVVLSLLDSTPQQPAPTWFDSAGRPTAAAVQAIGRLTSAAADALDPDDYDAAGLEERAAALLRRPSSVDERAAFDLELTEHVIRYLHDLHAGRVDPGTIGYHIHVPRDMHDYTALLRTAIASGDFARAAEELTPRFAQYRSLRAALERYRTIARGGPIAAPAPRAKSVRPGETYPGAQVLGSLLVASGDLQRDVALPTLIYAGELVEGVKRFQARHGLEPDGVIGVRTQAALDVPIAWRVRQIELSMERLRWLPHLVGERFVAVNIPMFRLWAADASPRADGPPALLTTAVIVGRAVVTQTPVMVEQMRQVIFRPYWNVPRSILLKEILPKIARDPGYLGREDLEIVAGETDNARHVEPTPAAIGRLRAGDLRLRQRPGPANSLGLIKFVFPNESDVYMHGTPVRHLFGRARRDFSHGCVRVEDPVSLAEWVLKDQEGWTRERIVEAMNGPGPRTLDLVRPIPVILYYVTAAVWPDGSVHFSEDIYGHDRRLDAALNARRHSPPDRPSS